MKADRPATCGTVRGLRAHPPGGATRVLGSMLARVRSHRGAPPSPFLGRRSGPGRGAPLRTTQPRVGDPPPSPRPAAGACRGRCPPGIARRVGPEPSDCAARCGPTGFHSGLRTDRRTAGLLCHVMGRTPSARLHTLGAVPGRQRDEEIAAVGYHSVCPSGMPRTSAVAGARKGPVRRTRSAGRSPDRAGPTHESSLICGPRAAEVRPGGPPCRRETARASLPSSPGLGPCQSGRRWGTDGPAATTNRSGRHAAGGPGDSDCAIAGPRAGRQRTAGPGAGGPSHGQVCD